MGDGDDVDTQQPDTRALDAVEPVVPPEPVERSEPVEPRELVVPTEPVEPRDAVEPATPVAPAAVTAPAAAVVPDPAVDDVDLSGYPGITSADGRKRRRTALAVLVAAIAAGGAGMWVGTRIQSPADRAAARQAPIPSLITVPVERRALTSEVVLPGEVAYNAPVTLQLAGGVGISPSETAVITEVKSPGTELNEGDVVVEVTSRPVFVLQGDLPMYRRMIVGTTGPDVQQLEEALVRLGYTVDAVDTVFDASTATAVEQMYADAGYPAEGPSDEQRAELAAAREAVTSAEAGVAQAREALLEAQAPLPESQRLQLEQSLQEAREAVPNAQNAAQVTRTEQEQIVNSARAARDTARTQRDAAAAIRDAARSGAIDPDTGEPYSVERLAALEVAASEAQQVLVDAEGQLVVAEHARDAAITAADAAIGDAQANLAIVQAQYNEATAAGNTQALEDAVTAAEGQLAAARTSLVELEAQAGTRISPGEIVFAPVLPSTLTETYVTLGSGIDGPIGMLTTTDTLVKARIARADAALVTVGSEVAIEIRDAGINTTGTVLSVGQPDTSGSEQPGIPGGGDSGSSGRMEVVVQPAGGTDLGMYMFWTVRVRVPVDATDGEVLVVPVAALTVGPDETSQVELERTPATATTPAVTEVVPVTVGLSANGLAEVAPIEPGKLDEGDRVVIGVDTHLLPGNAEGESPSGGDGGDGGDDGDDDGGDDGGDDGDDGAAASPLAALFGWVQDPVEQRRRELEIQEYIVDCMTAEGWEYQAVDWSAQMPDQPDEEWGSPEFGRKYGYGVMYQYELSDDPGGGMGIDFEDPNQEYVNGLSEAEQEAYYADLYGGNDIWPSEPEIDEDGNEFWPSPPLDQQGCQGKAQLEVVGEDPTSDPEVQKLLNDYYLGQESDAGLAEIVRKWRECFQPTLDEYGIDFQLTDIWSGQQAMELEKFRAFGVYEIVRVASQAEADEYWSSGQMVIAGFTDENGVGYLVIDPTGQGGGFGGPAATSGVGLRKPVMPDTPELTGEQIDRLTAMELDLWVADQACQDEVGYAEYNLQREQELVDRILEQFPELAG